MKNREALVEASLFVLAFFPLIYFVELKIFAFFVPFVEEGFARLIPLLVVFTLHSDANPYSVGLVTGLTFGALEILTKTISLGYFSWLMLVPVAAVHVPNAVAQSLVINFCYSRRSYALIPVVYIICVLWHWIYNANLYVV